MYVIEHQNCANVVTSCSSSQNVITVQSDVNQSVRFKVTLIKLCHPAWRQTINDNNTNFKWDNLQNCTRNQMKRKVKAAKHFNSWLCLIWEIIFLINANISECISRSIQSIRSSKS